MKKFLAMLLALIMVLSMAACGNSNSPEATDAPAAPTDGAAEVVEWVDPFADLAEDYDAQSEAIYNMVMGDFLAAYEVAKEAETVSERHALMAIAEAKLYETGIMLPLTANGGNYAISRAVPYTVSSALWGNDSYRYHNIVICTEPLTVADRNELKALWAELAGSGSWEGEAMKLVES